MAPTVASVCLGFVAQSAHGFAQTASDWTCNMTDADPRYEDFQGDESRHLTKWQVLDLDLPPRERWAGIVGPKAAALAQVIAAYKAGARSSPTLSSLFQEIEKAGAELLDGIPEDYAEEMRGMASATGIPVQDIFMVNMMYELSGAGGSDYALACTSIVAQDADGHVMHGRNMDFGAGTPLTDLLRGIVVQLRFTKRGETLFESTSFLGYMGCLTCTKPGSFSMSVDTRHWGSSGGETSPQRLFNWISGKDRSGSFLGFITRDAFQTDVSFASAVERVNSTKMLGPGYYIVAGIEKGQGAIVTREPEESLHFWSLDDAPYILVTNYDHWNLDPTYANCCDRTLNGNACMDKIVAEEQVHFAGVFQVLSSKPNLAPGTIATTLMSASTGQMESYFQYYIQPDVAVQV